MKDKICGTASLEAARMAAEAGADYVGSVVDVDFSERSIDMEQALQIRQAIPLPFVVLCFDQDVAWTRRLAEFVQPAAIQLLGHESPKTVRQLRPKLSCEIWKSLFLPEGTDQTTSELESQLREDMQIYVDAGADKLLLDTVDVTGKRFGGTGKTSDWALATRLIQGATVPVFLSGGIDATNVSQAVSNVCPYGIDLCSGVESERGKRDPAKLQALMQALSGLR